LKTPKLSVINFSRKTNSKTLKEVLKTDDNSLADFVKKCFVWNANYRMTPDEALSHPWLEDAIKRVKK
jgi:hypothetical protein